MTWEQQASRLAEAADNARSQGDIEAFVELITAACGCLQIARNLKTIEAALAREVDQGRVG